MPHELELLQTQINRLEHQLRWLKIAAVVLAILAVAFALSPRPSAQQPEALRVRQLIVEDVNGRARVVLGPLDAPGNTRRIGMRVNDPNGAERFGVSYMEGGRVGLGLDAPPGTGDDRNRERINLVADEEGGAHIRLLDRRTNVVSRMYLDEQNRAWLSFSDFTQTPAMIHRYGLTGEETIRPGQ
ncbi:MAG TPA: hypothetical protein VGQ37_19185 [Vicinamibacterales bacterium]|jgi:hypothetical protein|nr:hypothetical protein [Vicinamibacterales bacterium]